MAFCSWTRIKILVATTASPPVSFLPSSRLRALWVIGTSYGRTPGQHRRGEFGLQAEPVLGDRQFAEQGVDSRFRQLYRSLIQVLTTRSRRRVFTWLPMRNTNECAVDAPNSRIPHGGEFAPSYGASGVWRRRVSPAVALTPVPGPARWPRGHDLARSGRLVALHLCPPGSARAGEPVTWHCGRVLGR
jgi:hypothetical protein